MSQKNSVSRTGLVLSPKKEQKLYSKRSRYDLNLARCAVVRPVQYSLRPFGGLFNPYSTNCSILCNHPGPSEIKQVVKQVKEQYNDGRGNLSATNADSYLYGDCGDCDIINVNQIIDPEKLPEEYFHHYTGSDSRPLTPTPTVISNRTRISACGSYLFQARRCHTPDPINTCAIERKQLVLDLRRSHSQETLLRNASSEISLQAIESSVMTNIERNQIDIQQLEQQQQPKNMRLCEQEARKRSAELKALQQQKESDSCSPTGIVCINDRNEVDEEIDGGRRRGKKKKKGKEGNTFRMNQEPETQITTIGPDSPNASARPLAAHDSNNKLVSTSSAEATEQTRDNPYLRSTFITEEALRILRRGLDIDIVESAFGKFVMETLILKMGKILIILIELFQMNKALTEAFRTIPSDQMNCENPALREFKQTIGIEKVDSEKWLEMPRKFTRSATRFRLPTNTQRLSTLASFEYLSQFVWVSNHRKQLYRFVFNKYLCDSSEGGLDDGNDGDSIESANTTEKPPSFFELSQCVMAYSSLDIALNDVLGYCGTVEQMSEHIVKIKEMIFDAETLIILISFRSWCGVVAFAERYLNPLSFEDDPSDEVWYIFRSIFNESNIVLICRSKLLILRRFNEKSRR